MSNEPNLNGPESVPLRDFIKTLPIVVSVYDLKTDKLENRQFIDYGNPDHRRWIGRVTAWAVLNGKSVETMAKSDFDQLPEDRK